MVSNKISLEWLFGTLESKVDMDIEDIFRSHHSNPND